MNQKNEGKENTAGVQQPKPDTAKEEKQQDVNERTTIGRAHSDEEDEVLPPEEIGNVTSGLAETPARPEPANGDPAPDDRDGSAS